jgi:5-methylcytosine-specific restriction endonuclease McrA
MTATAILAPVKPCKKCGASDRRADGRCSPCATAYFQQYYAKNTDKLKAYQADLYAKNPETKRNHSKAYYANNIEKVKPKRVAYAAKNAKAACDRAKAWAMKNPERAKQRLIEWRVLNPDAVKVLRHNRRERERTGKLSGSIAKKLFAAQKGKCPCCRLPLGDDYHMDHIVPLYLGGLNVDSNIQLLRATCNLQKNKKHPVDFMQERGFLL